MPKKFKQVERAFMDRESGMEQFVQSGMKMKQKEDKAPNPNAERDAVDMEIKKMGIDALRAEIIRKRKEREARKRMSQ